ncbi:MAG: glycosyltransferase family 4 protein [Actinobacteria bacterium]|nr:glycosyltransferase family 4 protein [Actinomycetota bacterium]
MPARPQLTVAFDVTPLVAARTGIGHFVADLYGALLDLEPGPALIPYMLSARARVSDAPVPDDTRRLPLPATVAVRLWRVFGGPPLDGRLAPANVIHGTNYVAPPSRSRAVVITVHDVAFARFPDLCPPAARAAGAVAGRLARRGAWIHTPSEYVATEVRELFGTDRVRAIPHGVPHLPPTRPDPAATSGVVPDDPYVLALGTLEPRKRHVDLVQAFAKLAAGHPDLRLVLAGSDGPARAEVEAAVAGLPNGARERVHLAGRVDDEVRAALLRHAAVLAYPSQYEGFGLPVLEAMAVGTPVVAARAGGVTECADGAALLVDNGPDHPQALADALDRMLGDPSLRSSLVEAGHRRACEFSWESTARRMAALYEEAAG